MVTRLTVNGLFFWRSHPLTATWFITVNLYFCRNFFFFFMHYPHSQHFGRTAMGGISMSSLSAPRNRAIPNGSFDYRSHLSEKD
jgi:hypothetical protein